MEFDLRVITPTKAYDGTWERFNDRHIAYIDYSENGEEVKAAANEILRSLGMQFAGSCPLAPVGTVWLDYEEEEYVLTAIHGAKPVYHLVPVLTKYLDDGDLLEYLDEAYEITPEGIEDVKILGDGHIEVIHSEGKTIYTVKEFLDKFGDEEMLTEDAEVIDDSICVKVWASY